MIVKTNCEADGSFAALISTHNNVVHHTIAAHGGVHDEVYNPCKEIKYKVKRSFRTGLEMNCIF